MTCLFNFPAARVIQILYLQSHLLQDLANEPTRPIHSLALLFFRPPAAVIVTHFWAAAALWVFCSHFSRVSPCCRGAGRQGRAVRLRPFPGGLGQAVGAACTVGSPCLWLMAEWQRCSYIIGFSPPLSFQSQISH